MDSDLDGLLYGVLWLGRLGPDCCRFVCGSTDACDVDCSGLDYEHVDVLF